MWKFLRTYHLTKKEKKAPQVVYENVSFSPRVIKTCIEKYDLVAVSNP